MSARRDRAFEARLGQALADARASRVLATPLQAWWAAAVVCFALEAWKTARRDDVATLFFIARDGDALDELCALAARRAGDDLRCEVFHYSRLVAQQPDDAAFTGLRAYLTSRLPPAGRRFAFVDLGWYGATTAELERQVAAEGRAADLAGFYFLAFNETEANLDRLNCRPLLDNLVQVNSSLFEYFARQDYGTTTGYEISAATVRPLLAPAEIGDRLAADAQAFALDLMDRLLDACGPNAVAGLPRTTLARTARRYARRAAYFPSRAAVASLRDARFPAREHDPQGEALCGPISLRKMLSYLVTQEEHRMETRLLWYPGAVARSFPATMARPVQALYFAKRSCDALATHLWVGSRRRTRPRPPGTIHRAPIGHDQIAAGASARLIGPPRQADGSRP